MKKESKEIKVGKAVKYTKVKFDVAKSIELYKSGKPVSAIALAIGFPPNCGQIRTCGPPQGDVQPYPCRNSRVALSASPVLIYSSRPTRNRGAIV